MEFRHLFYVNLVLCVITFLEVLFTIRKNALIKTCFLLIISSLFVMNFYSFITVTNRFQFILVKCMRITYVCSTMLAVIHLVTPKIPTWIVGITIFSICFLIGLRLYYFDQIVIDSQAPVSTQVFAVGHEFQSPPAARFIVFALVILVTGIIYYYYRQFLFKMNRENIHYRHFCRFIIAMVLPFFLLVIFGMLGNFSVLEPGITPYLFSVFSFIIIFSILYRPKLLNKTDYFHHHLRQ